MRGGEWLLRNNYCPTARFVSRSMPHPDGSPSSAPSLAQTCTVNTIFIPRGNNYLERGANACPSHLLHVKSVWLTRRGIGLLLPIQEVSDQEIFIRSFVRARMGWNKGNEFAYFVNSGASTF